MSDLPAKYNVPTIIVLLGATGDLTARKIAPALCHLFSKKHLPGRLKIVGFSRRGLQNKDFQKHIAVALGKHGKKTVSHPFLNLFSYIQGEFQNIESYKALAQSLKQIDDEWGVCTNKLFYLAVPPQFYETIFENLDATDLTRPCGDPNWTRVIVEKPFGKDAETAQKIDNMLGGLFKEEQIYRIDHYLGKEMVQNILAFRFSNNLFEKNWNKDSVEKIEIKLLETEGAERRGEFYDSIGALRDVGQNHLLQMLALVAMEHPEKFETKTIRRERLRALKSLKPLHTSDMLAQTFRAQYEGYRDVKGVAQNSNTETYFKIKAELSSPRWEGVPIIIESGKGLAVEQKEIVVTFRHTDLCLCPPGVSEHYKNQIVFHLSPQEGMTIKFFAKKAGSGMNIEPREFTFNFHKTKKSSEHVEEYALLLLSSIKGDQTLFVQTEEVRAMWQFVDPILKAWKEARVPLGFYKKGSNSSEISQ